MHILYLYKWGKAAQVIKGRALCVMQKEDEQVMLRSSCTDPETLPSQQGTQTPPSFFHGVWVPDTNVHNHTCTYVSFQCMLADCLNATSGPKIHIHEVRNFTSMQIILLSISFIVTGNSLLYLSSILYSLGGLQAVGPHNQSFLWGNVIGFLCSLGLPPAVYAW